MSEAQRFTERMRAGMRSAEKRYGHLSPQALDELARKRAIPVHVYEYLRATRPRFNGKPRD